MIFELYNYTCNNCHYFFKAPEIAGNAYGEFIMRTAGGEIQYCDAISDAVFQELKKSYKQFVPEEIQKKDDGSLFQTIFSICCDKSTKGFDFEIDRTPNCPKCHTTDSTTMIGPDNPPETIELDMPAVTHHEWNKLTAQEKLHLTQQAVTAYMKQKFSH